MESYTLSGNYFGHEIYNLYNTDEWYFADNDEFVGVSGDFSGCKRKCVKCGNSKTKDGHDPCIESLPEVIYACCGHGYLFGYPYIMRTDRSIERFSNFEEMKRYLKDNLNYDTKE